MANFDLHIHTRYSSDGEQGIPRIVELCATQGVRVFSTSDHNCVRANAEALPLAREHGLGFIPGIEIDCTYHDTDLHLLGYGIDFGSADFGVLEAEMRTRFMASFDQMIDNLHRLGFCVDARAVLDKAAGEIPTGELIAEVMLETEACHTPLLAPYMPGGARSDMPPINFYLDYFAQGRPAFVPVQFMSYAQAVELIRDNGGTPVVAHPGLNFRGREPIAEELLRHGAAGLEVFNNYHSAEQATYFATLVVQNKALMTCGSDFHGKNKPRIEIGRFPLDDRYADYLAESAGKLSDV